MSTEITGFLFVGAYRAKEQHYVREVVEKVFKKVCRNEDGVNSVYYYNGHKVIRIGFQCRGSCYDSMEEFRQRVYQLYPTAFGFEFFVD